MKTLVQSLGRPTVVFGTAFALSLVYILLSTDSILLNTLIQNQLWATLGAAAYVEIFDSSLPETSDASYIAAYLICTLLPLALRLVAIYTGIYGSRNFRIAAVISSLVAVVAVFGLDQLFVTSSGELKTTAVPHDMMATLRDLARLESGATSLNPMNSTFEIASTSPSTDHPMRPELNDASKTCWLGWFTLPRFWYRSRQLPMGQTTGFRRSQLVLAAVYCALYNLFFYFLMIFTERFRADHLDEWSKAMYFLVYIVICYGFRLALKCVGRGLDESKRGTASLYFIGDVMSLLFYFSFYRVLFESISSWATFFFFQFLHLGSEWLAYPGRYWRGYYEAAKRIEGTSELLSGFLIPNCIGFEDWQEFIVLEFSLRCVVMVAVGLSILVLTVVIDFSPWINNRLKQSSASAIELNVELLLTAVVLEIINAVLISRVLSTPSSNRSLLKAISRCFSNLKFCVLTTIIAANLLINPLAAFLPEDA